MKIHRVGTITLGSVLILFGGLFFIHIFIPDISYQAVFHLWPLTLILLGIETLSCSKKYDDFHYDFGAVLMALLVGLLTVLLASADLYLTWAGSYAGLCL